MNFVGGVLSLSYVCLCLSLSPDLLSFLSIRCGITVIFTIDPFSINEINHLSNHSLINVFIPISPVLSPRISSCDTLHRVVSLTQSTFFFMFPLNTSVRYNTGGFLMYHNFLVPFHPPFCYIPSFAGRSSLRRSEK